MLGKQIDKVVVSMVAVVVNVINVLMNVSVINKGVLKSRLGWQALFILFKCLD